MKPRDQPFKGRAYTSRAKSDINAADATATKVVAWANSDPIVRKIVLETKSRAFGRDSPVYNGYAWKKRRAAALERVRLFQALATGKPTGYSGDPIFKWSARFTLEHYRRRGFTGGRFQQHIGKRRGPWLYLDYTPGTFDEVLDQFCEWMAWPFRTCRITLDGKTVRTIEEDSLRRRQEP